MLNRLPRNVSWAIWIGLVFFPAYVLYSEFIKKPQIQAYPKPVQGKLIINDDNYQELHQDDPDLAKYIRTLLKAPSSLPYHLAHPQKVHFTSMEQSKYVGNLYGPGKREGFFIEVGAHDGEQSSSSLYLERSLGFHGLLIEPNPRSFEILTVKHRKAYTLQAALSPTTSSAELSFAGSGQQGHLTDINNKKAIQVKAFPLFAILSAMNITFIDVLNLDIEGFEFKVLKTIPFNKVQFGVFIVEHFKIPEPKGDLVQFMADNGYKKIHENYMDYIFGDPNYLSKLPGWKS